MPELDHDPDPTCVCYQCHVSGMAAGGRYLRNLVRQAKNSAEQLELGLEYPAHEFHGKGEVEVTNRLNERRTSDTGAVRDDRKGKGRYDLLPPFALDALARHFERGAEVYGDRNWEKGQPFSWFIDSGLRHVFEALQWRYKGALHISDDHFRAATWNFLALLDTLEKVNQNMLPPELDDLPCDVK